MEIGKYLCALVFSLLLLISIKTTWAEQKIVLDDDGSVITELEINENMSKGYRIGCISGGSVLSIFPAGIGGSLIAAGICGGWFYDSDQHVMLKRDVDK